MKIYAVTYYAYDDAQFGPVFSTRELAEKFAGKDNNVEEWEVLTESPKRVKWSQVYGTVNPENGKINWHSRRIENFDYEIGELPGPVIFRAYYDQIVFEVMASNVAEGRALVKAGLEEGVAAVKKEIANRKRSDARYAKRKANK